MIKVRSAAILAAIAILLAILGAVAGTSRPALPRPEHCDAGCRCLRTPQPEAQTLASDPEANVGLPAAHEFDSLVRP
jgi:hypothetical protein